VRVKKHGLVLVAQNQSVELVTSNSGRLGMGEGQQRKVVLEPRGFSGVAVRRRHIPEGDSLGPYTDYHVLVGENLRTGE
jgi:hypothetical protein